MQVFLSCQLQRIAASPLNHLKAETFVKATRKEICMS
jgi:hypothetical protein